MNEAIPLELETLPAELRNQLHEAALAGDLVRLSNAVGKVEDLQKNTATHLKSWLTNLRIDRFQQVFDPNKPAEKND